MRLRFSAPGGVRVVFVAGVLAIGACGDERGANDADVAKSAAADKKADEAAGS